MAKLFEPFTLKDLTLKNRIMMSPMCQYSVWDEDGKPNEWHYVHYISRAVGGTALIMIEMTDVDPNGRITVRDLGLWSDDQIPAFRRIIDQVHQYGAKIGIQIAHAGRKTESPSLQPVAPSAIAFSDRYRVPQALSIDEIHRLVDNFGLAAKRAVKAGVDTIELHGAHGYLIHQFMSPLSNHRSDVYGEPTRFGVEVIESVKSHMPQGMPLIMRLSATEYVDGGYDFPSLEKMAEVYRDHGVDMFDVSSGGNAPVVPKMYPGYQVSYAATLREHLNVPVIAVGMLETPELAEFVLEQQQADVIAIARGMLRNPYWANTAAQVLGGTIQVPPEYDRAFPKDFVQRAHE
ncbi:NADH:flavin oxidoreductase/NADH oxidase [Sulfobacillus thermosulfidooxidans]|uniref:NADH:flavin oxidoreductase/NADH oxidase n=1 Tax=Sulfobacillus thermosulfidooxidans TaxID=28034 RepID=UPI00096B7D19|nr:NADH:flavin oxidoreductase/NADH oxidase [Sulfobacillus thermosulfidooxidans]OLZ11144.1 NADPH dehydrogenase [Sulfobacillus thermosulfidooxidans]OLZ14127.1 NADPH dehydrogenase [Sulfobacillus thermosulfidooxidans]OLZ18871.1 NADPH dehydrogenase [Sulfobacillus thermosulfidooxidans]